ncbi:MAG: hypothetical protein JXA64_06135 [Candidatus Fermentibacteraceae bacterium]|nr:hypothetical protein [Candidatus Fermentibacteraceae bacterium]
MTGKQLSVYTSASDPDNGTLVVAAAGMSGSRHYGVSAGWTGSEDAPDTLRAAISTARTIRGDPVGFMDGVFGPSISIGTSLGYISADDGSGGTSSMLSAELGFQFSVFPTVAIGADMSGIRLLGDRLGNRRVDYGFTTVFDKRFRGHFSVTDGNASVGFELGVKDWLTVRSGSDGSSWNSGATLQLGWFELEWAVALDDADCRQVFGMTFTREGGP